MVITNLKNTAELEKILQKSGLPYSEIEIIRKELLYFDEYYLTSTGVVTVFRQEFVKDPYIELERIPEVRLIAYPDSATLSEISAVFGNSNLPIITRASEKNLESIKALNFSELLNKKGEPTVLLPIHFIIPRPARTSNKNILPMTCADLAEIEELFKQQYSLRYRMVKLMHDACPDGCFVYRLRNKIAGVAFSRINRGELELYVRQLFVEENMRRCGIGKTLYDALFRYASKQNVHFAKANIRQETVPFHEKLLTPERIEGVEYYLMRGKR